MSSDRHTRRVGDDYADALANLLPTGPAWPRDQDGVLMRLQAGLAEVWGGKVDPRAADLLEREADPRVTFELLPDWERAFGLPDACVDEPLTIGDRQRALVERMTTEGGQSRPFFIELAARLGYTIRIREFAPFMCGISQCGDTRPTGAAGEDYRWEIGPEEMRFYWTARIDRARLAWFRTGAGGGQVGVDPHLQIGIASDLECLFQRFKPAHTRILFDYSGLGDEGPLAGTP